MKIILLSGQSLSNKDWIEEVNKTLKVNSYDTEVMYYSHWERGEGKADVEKETERLIQLINSLSEDYFIFAKSIGTVIFFNSIKRLRQWDQ